MDALRTRLQRCADELHIEVPAALLAQVDQLAASPRSPRELRLASTSFAPQQWRLLAKSLAADTVITSLDVSDCLLGDEGCIMLCSALQSNRRVCTLNLSQNNIAGHGAHAIGELLRTSLQLRELLLEWNGLGTWDAGLAVLAEGIACTSSLGRLDLKNNQIMARGGQQLATALAANKSIRHLDLRWNFLGPEGGKALLQALDSNRTLTALHLDGNHIPEPTMEAIEAKLERNKVEMQGKEAQEAAASRFHRQLDQLGESKENATREVFTLRQELADTSAKGQHLDTKLALTEQALTSANAQLKEMGELVVKLRSEAAAARSEREASTTRAAEQASSNASRLADLQRELQTKTIETTTLSHQLQTLQDENKRLRDWNDDRARQFDDQEAEKERLHRDKLRNAEDAAAAEATRLREAVRAAEHARDKALSDLERARSEAQAQVAAAASQAQALAEKAAQQLRQEQEERRREWQDTQRSLVAARDQLEKKVAAQEATIEQLRQQTERLQAQVEESRRDAQREQMRLQQDVKDAQAKQTSAEADRQGEAAQVARLQAELAALKRERDKDLEQARLEAQRARDETARLRDKLRDKNEHFDRIRTLIPAPSP